MTKASCEVYYTTELNDDEVEFLSLFFKDHACIRKNGIHTTIMPMNYKELETVIIPSVKIVKEYQKYIDEHKDVNRINNIFMENFWSKPPWEFSIDKDDIEKVDLINSLEKKGYTVTIVEQDELSYDLKVEI